MLVARVPAVQALQDAIQEQRRILARQGRIQSPTGCSGVSATKNSGLEGLTGVGMQSGSAAHNIARSSGSRSSQLKYRAPSLGAHFSRALQEAGFPAKHASPKMQQMNQ